MSAHFFSIPPSQRPHLPHEHPSWSLYWRYLKQHIKHLPYKKSLLQSVTAKNILVNPALSFVKLSETGLTTEQQNSFLTSLKAATSNDKLTTDLEVSNLYLQSIKITEYILTHWVDHYASDKLDYARAYYPGFPSEQGIESDSIEGVSRITPLVAAYLEHYRQRQSLTVEQALEYKVCYPLDQELVTKLRTALSKSFLAATDPRHQAYWGELENYTQTICEAHDFAIALYLSREEIFLNYSKKEQLQIINWLQKISSCKTVDNNWHLFILICEFVLAKLVNLVEKEAVIDFSQLTELINVQQQVPALNNPEALTYHSNYFARDFQISIYRYRRIQEFDTKTGWYRDGCKGDFDYYNSWGFYYSLYFLTEIGDGVFDLELLSQNNDLFAQDFIKLFSPTGFAFFSRSVSYRLGATTGLFTDLLYKQLNPKISCLSDYPGQVIRALITNNNSFIANGALDYGMLSQGLLESDRRLVDPYSGPASPYWSLRPYILLLTKGIEANLFKVNQEPLAVERQDYHLSLDSISTDITAQRIFRNAELAKQHSEQKLDLTTASTAEVLAYSVNQEFMVTAQFKLTQYPFNPKAVAKVKPRLIPILAEKVFARSFRAKCNFIRLGFTSFSSDYSLYLK